jgi:hypothetical protein
VFEGFLGAPDGKFDGTGSISVKPVEVQSVVVDGTEFRLEHRHTLPFFDERKGGTVGRIRDAAFVRAVPADPFSAGEARATAGLVQVLMIWLRLEVAGTESVLADGRRAPRRYADVLYSPAALGKHAGAVASPTVLAGITPPLSGPGGQDQPYTACGQPLSMPIAAR